VWVYLAAVNDPWGEPEPDPMPKQMGPTQPRNSADNPGSAGPMSTPDPEGWGSIEPSSVSMAASLDEFAFEPDLAATAADLTDSSSAGGLDTASDEGSEAMLHDEPEGALPGTDGSLDSAVHDYDECRSFSPDASGGLCTNCFHPASQHTGSAISPTDLSLADGYDDDLSPEDTEIQTTGTLDDVVASFQAGASHLAPTGGADEGGNADIAQAAREALSKMALKDFTPAEQQALLREGDGSQARNLATLDLAGTHYEPLEAALSAMDDDEDWLA
jgi:hypothetical protein